MEEPGFYLENVIKEKDELKNFEGPLSLILLLLAKNKVEIRDIKIADILDQYLAWLAKMQEMDLEIASEFVQMASHLLYIKTKMLLAGEKTVSELEMLLESLEKLKASDTAARLHEVLPQLKTMADRGILYHTKLPEPIERDVRTYEYKHTPAELLKALSAVYSRDKALVDYTEVTRAIPHRIVYNIKDKSREILEKVRGKNMTLSELYRQCSSRSEIVATFISVLELCSGGTILLDMQGHDVELSFAGGNIEEILDGISDI